MTSNGPLPGPYVENQREGAGAGSRRQSRAPVSTGAAGPLGTLPHCSQNLLTLPPLEERPIIEACIFQPYYNLCA